jgi:phospholipase/carboxylesterase
MTPLRCHVLGPDTASVTVVLLHGFGAPGDDLVPLAPELCRIRPRLKTEARWIFPEAPLGLEPAGQDSRAWWLIDIPRMQMLGLQGEAALEGLREETPVGLDLARESMRGVLDAVRREKPADGQWILGGFSQGAMLSIELALGDELGPDGLLIFSGSLINAREWRRRVSPRRNIPVFQSHGTEDPLLSYADAEKVRDLLISTGHHVEFVSFPGGHTIPRIALEGAAALLDGLLE